ncbi:MAG: 50S ribosomal protein L24 [Nitrosopumilus sp. D6]|nr:MAG: 50S ribosomal protein L24 [Nitrosopumilus sp. D6]
MKPTKMRNKMIHRATNVARSRQVGAALSKDLQKKYKKHSVRITVGDSIKIVRGEFAGVDGKVSKVSVENGTIAIEGLKKEKSKGDKFDVYIHASNVIITSLNTENWWRIARLEGKNPKETDLRESRTEDAAPEDEVDEDDDEQDDEQDGEKPDKEVRAEERKAIADEKRLAEQKRTEQKKQKDKKRQEKPPKEEDAEDYDDYEEDDD